MCYLRVGERKSVFSLFWKAYLNVVHAIIFQNFLLCDL
jgi:hypothetical protein